MISERQAGEDLKSGDAVFLGGDGKLYRCEAHEQKGAPWYIRVFLIFVKKQIVFSNDWNIYTTYKMFKGQYYHYKTTSMEDINA